MYARLPAPATRRCAGAGREGRTAVHPCVGSRTFGDCQGLVSWATLVEPERGLTAWHVGWPGQFRLEWAVDEVPSTGHFRPPVAWIRQPEGGQTSASISADVRTGTFDPVWVMTARRALTPAT